MRKRELTAGALVLCLLAGCVPGAETENTPAATETPAEESIPTSTPEPTVALPSWEEDPKGYVLNRLEECLHENEWTVRFWIFPGSGPVPVEMPASEFGPALRSLFSGLDWTPVEKPAYDEDPAAGAYSVQFVPGYISGYGSVTEPIGCRSNDPVLWLDIHTEEGYKTLYFQAEGAEALCDQIADLWPGPEAELGRVRVPSQETKEATAKAYLEEVFARLEANGHITGHEIRFLEIEPPYVPEGEETAPDASGSLTLRTILALKPADPTLSCWQEGREEGTDWVRYGKLQVSLSLDPDDGAYGLSYYDWVE